MELLSGAERIREKIKAFAHSEYDNDKYEDLKYIQMCIDNGIYLFREEKIKPKERVWLVLFPFYLIFFVFVIFPVLLIIKELRGKSDN